MQRFSSDERAILSSVFSMGPKMIGHLEAIGVTSLATLAGREAAALAFEINLHLGRAVINRTGIAALDNAIDAARRHCADTHAPPLPADWIAEIDALLAGGRRVILGLTGTPGAGKSSAAAALAGHYGARAALLPMDGFHLANDELARLGLIDRKGAPASFDAAGFVALLARLRADEPLTVYAPVFRREIEAAVAGSIAVRREHRLIITEGNYLLLDGAFAGVRPLLDACWYVDIARGERQARLIARHARHGRDAAAARAWIAGNDEPNAQLVESTRPRADRLIRWPPE